MITIPPGTGFVLKPRDFGNNFGPPDSLPPSRRISWIYPFSLLAKSREPSGVQASPRKPALLSSLSEVPCRTPWASARKTFVLFRTAKNSPVGCKARSIGRPLNEIAPPSTRCPVETRNDPSGCRPIQRTARRAMPAIPTAVAARRKTTIVFRCRFHAIMIDSPLDGAERSDSAATSSRSRRHPSLADVVATPLRATDFERVLENAQGTARKAVNDRARMVIISPTGHSEQDWVSPNWLCHLARRSEWRRRRVLVLNSCELESRLALSFDPGFEFLGAEMRLALSSSPWVRDLGTKRPVGFDFPRSIDDMGRNIRRVPILGSFFPTGLPNRGEHLAFARDRCNMARSGGASPTLLPLAR